MSSTTFDVTPTVLCTEQQCLPLLHSLCALPSRSSWAKTVLIKVSICLVNVVCQSESCTFLFFHCPGQRRIAALADNTRCVCVCVCTCTCTCRCIFSPVQTLNYFHLSPGTFVRSCPRWGLLFMAMRIPRWSQCWCISPGSCGEAESDMS